MEEAEDFQLVIHLKKGIFQQEIRKKKIKQLLSEKRRKEYFIHQDLSITHEEDLGQFEQNEKEGDINNMDCEQIQEILELILHQIKEGDELTIETIANNAKLIDDLIKILKNCMNKDESNNESNEKLIFASICILTNLTYYIKNNQNFYQQLIESIFSPFQQSFLMVEEGSCQENERNLMEQIALKYAQDTQILEYLISFSTNLMFVEDRNIFLKVIESQSIFEILINLLKNKLHNNQLIEEISHLVYNITRQKQFYKFQDIDEILYIDYLLLPLVNENTLAMNRVIQSISYALDMASQQEFIDFILLNHQIFEFLSLYIATQTNKSNVNNVKDEESIQIILEIFLLSCESISDYDQEVTEECSHIKQLIWISAQSTFYFQNQNSEITLLSLKIMNSILEYSHNTEYFIRNLLEKIKDENQDNVNPNALKEIILQCCEWNNSTIANEFISFLCQLARHSYSLSQICLLLNYGLIYIFIESLKTDFLYYETKDEIFQTIIQLFNLNEKFEQQEVCNRIFHTSQRSIQQFQGAQVLENYFNCSITQKTQHLIEQILYYLDLQIEFE